MVIPTARSVVVRTLTTLMVAATLSAVELAAVWSDHAVVQADVPLTVWGWGTPGERITVRLGNQVVGTTEVDAAKTWHVALPVQKAGALPDLTVQGATTLTVTDLQAGEVWLCAGQSNMDVRLSSAENAQADIAAAEDSGLRVFHEGNGRSDTPMVRCKGAWVPSSPATAGKASAVAWCFARHLRKALGRPVGVLVTAVGGTPITAWTPAPVLAADTGLQDLIREAQAASERLKAAGPPAKGPASADAISAKNLNLQDQATLYQGKIHPLEPWPIRGVLWYQGEADSYRGAYYATLLRGLIGGWRAGRAAEVPFIIVGLPGYGSPAQPMDRDGRSFSLVRESQQRVARDLPGVGVIAAVDLGEAGNIHPRRKQEVGRRAGLWAEQHVYGRQVVSAGPGFGTAAYAPGRVEVPLTGESVGARLTGPGGFQVAGEDRVFVAATATVREGSVILEAPGVAQPVAWRYAFTNTPPCPLVNGAGLPTLPHRSDDWPLQPAH